MINKSEVWKDIEGYEGLYQVSNFGRVKSLIKWNGHEYLAQERIIDGWVQECRYGYKRKIISLIKHKERQYFFVHRLVGIAFLPNDDASKNQINHKDGNPLNNHVENLEWCTNRENQIHSYLYLRKPHYDANKIIEMFNNGESVNKICEENGITTTTFYRTLKKYDKEPKGRPFYKTKYNIDRNELIADFEKKELTNKELQKKYNCTKGLIATYRYKYKKGELKI